MVTFNYNPDEKVITAIFAGRLDTLAVQKLSEIIMLNLPLKDGKSEDKVIFDLTGVEYISSSFIRICLNIAKQAGSGMFSIIHCQPFIKKNIQNLRTR